MIDIRVSVSSNKNSVQVFILNKTETKAVNTYIATQSYPMLLYNTRTVLIYLYPEE